MRYSTENDFKVFILRFLVSFFLLFPKSTPLLYIYFEPKKAPHAVMCLFGFKQSIQAVLKSHFFLFSIGFIILEHLILGETVHLAEYNEAFGGWIMLF